MTAAQGALVDAAWLQRRREDPSLRVCDVTAALPGEMFDAQAAFEEAHVPGATFLDLERFSDPDTTLPHMIPSAARFARTAGQAGIGNDTTLVLYEGRRPFTAPRGWFLFRLFGHDRVHVLDGGLPAWRADGGPVQSGHAPAPAPATFLPRLRASLLAGLGDVEQLAADAIVLDARSAERFDGTAPEPRPGIRSGHIPRSRNLPYGRLLQDDGRFRSADELRRLFDELGVPGDRPVVTSCGTGVTAAILTLGLHLAGFPDSRLFDGSWTEYALAHPEAA